MSLFAFLRIPAGGFTAWHFFICALLLFSVYILLTKWASTALRQSGDTVTNIVEPRGSATLGKVDIVSELRTSVSGDEGENVINIASIREMTTRPSRDDVCTQVADTPERMLAYSDYTVGWICALSKEYVAAQVFLDETHEGPGHVHPSDNNDYTLGRIGSHKVVIAVLPQGEYGISSATGVAKDMLHSFPSIKIGLMVGIGGGAPTQKHDIRLGDVVVSTPRDGNGGVLQYDFGKAMQGGIFHTTGFLNKPPTLLRTAVNGLEAYYEINGHRIEEAISSIFEERPKLRRKYERPQPNTDRLYKPTVVHPSNTDGSCNNCCGDDSSKLIPRADRSPTEDSPAIHYGLIASANQVMKDAVIRDGLIKEKDVVCFEMEAAGLMDQFPCLVIRGICDYSDSHKNKEWQGYAAMAAAAYTRDLLYRIPLHKVEVEKRICDVLSGVQRGVDELLCVQQDKRHQKILEWLTPIDYAPQQKDYITVRQPGTGDWFLGSEEYQAWVKSDKKTLFCPGVPGAGKTIMTAAVIDDLYTKYKDDADKGIAYLYCDFRRQYEQKAEDLLANLLKQLAQRQAKIPENVQVLHHKYKGALKQPSLDELSAALLVVSSTHYSKIFIIVDAVDECQGVNGCRKSFLSNVFKLQEKANANIFATSRLIPEILEAFNKSISLTISARDEDVQTYLAGQLTRLPSFVLSNPELQNKIKDTIFKSVDGMFLLVRLHVDSLAQLPTKGHVKQALRTLPSSLGKTYEQAMARIESQGEVLQKVAKKVLCWLIYAKRVLSITELQHAVAIEPGTPELDREFIPDKEILGSICAGLVTIDTKSGVMRLAHYTIQEYFEGEGKRWFREAETDITTACLTYLSFRAFEGGFCHTGELKQRLQSNPLYHYAASNWGHHARAAPEIPLILDFLNNKAKVSAASQAMLSSRGVPLGSRMVAIHLAAYFGLESIATNLFERGHGINVMDSQGRTPLSWASENGHQGVAKLLLDSGAKVDLTGNPYCQTPLWWAIRQENEDLVKLLLENGAGANYNIDNDSTPLGWAIAAGNEGIVKLLLENGANAKRTIFGQTPFVWATRRGKLGIAQLLLHAQCR
ncbi:hypothetical protein V8C37DRAFT_367055 [Trichoderma ceciliae]